MANEAILILQSAVSSPQHKTYNYRLNKTKIVVENAFGRLKGRWRGLMKRNDMHVDNIPVVITAACILHNICKVHGESFNESWLLEADSGSNFPQPITVAH